MNQPYDAPFDLFDTPTPVVRAVSAREADDALNKVSWRRYKIAGIVCWEWANAKNWAFADRCGPAVWLRIHGPDQRALCSRHKQEYMDKDALAVPRGE